MNTEREKQQHNCRFCGKAVYDNNHHDSFYNDLVIHADDSPDIVKLKMQRQDRLKSHDIFAVNKKYPVPKEWSEQVK